MLPSNNELTCRRSIALDAYLILKDPVLSGVICKGAGFFHIHYKAMIELWGLAALGRTHCNAMTLPTWRFYSKNRAFLVFLALFFTFLVVTTKDILILGVNHTRIILLDHCRPPIVFTVGSKLALYGPTRAKGRLDNVPKKSKRVWNGRNWLTQCVFVH